MKKVYCVVYHEINFGKYFGGHSSYRDEKRKYFTSRKKAQAFIDAPVMYFMQMWNKDVEIKDAGDGTIEVIEVE